MSDFEGTEGDVAYLLRPRTIRERAWQILRRAEAGGTGFKIDSSKAPDLARFVAKVTRDNYPDLHQIPFHSRWRHFGVGGVDRASELKARLGKASPEERARAQLDLAIVSVLLDAGAGMAWRYQEVESGQEFSRSEGLAVASFRMFMAGAFSADKSPSVDAEGLERLSVEELRAGFQVSESNPLVAVEGRQKLLADLAKALRASPRHFGSGRPRPGNLLDHFKSVARSSPRAIPAADVLHAIQLGMGSIWPGRVSVRGFNLGDVWPYPPLGQGIPGLVPFHKLSQWMAYSLLEPLEEYGFQVEALDDLTVLPEYRNGGLILDGGLISLRDPSDAEKSWTPDSERIVEWRALTVALVERLAEGVRKELGVDPDEFPLVKILEGGTWWAGRKLAAEKRPDGGPPLRIISDGTVF